MGRIREIEIRIYNLAAALISLVVAHGTYASSKAPEPLASKSQECLKLLIGVSRDWQPVDDAGRPERWLFDGQDGAKFYDKDFKDLYSETGETSLSEILSHRRNAGRNNNVLDLFGSGFVVEDQSLADSITGLRFGPFSRATNEEDLKALIAKLPLTPVEVLGDVMNLKTWDRLHQSMDARGIAKMDLVVMRPDGAWQLAPFAATAEQNALAISFLIYKVIQVLSEDGRFYFSVIIPQLPGSLALHPIFQALVKYVEIETKFHLTLYALISAKNTTYKLNGSLIPKD